jgi:hypothetical protein
MGYFEKVLTANGTRERSPAATLALRSGTKGIQYFGALANDFLRWQLWLERRLWAAGRSASIMSFGALA